MYRFKKNGYYDNILNLLSKCLGIVLKHFWWAVLSLMFWFDTFIMTYYILIYCFLKTDKSVSKICSSPTVTISLFEFILIDYLLYVVVCS